MGITRGNYNVEINPKTGYYYRKQRKTIFFFFKVQLFQVASFLVGTPLLFLSDVLSISLPPQRKRLFFSLSSLRRPHLLPHKILLVLGPLSQHSLRDATVHGNMCPKA